MTHRPSRSSIFLTNLATLLLVLGIGFGLYLLVSSVLGFTQGDEVAVHTAVDADRVADLPPRAVAPEEVDVVVRVPDPSYEQVWWATLRDLPAAIVVIAVVWLVRGLLKSVRDGDPFIKPNVRRLRIIALIVLVGIPIAESLRSLFAGELAASAGLSGPGAALSISGYGNALLGGLAILVLSEVFSEGVRMRGDLEGTI
jgi:hypothetical protein